MYAVTYLYEKSDLWKEDDEDITNYFLEYPSEIFNKFRNPTHYEVFGMLWSMPVY